MISKAIPIFFSFDNNYVKQGAVAINSLLSNAKLECLYYIYIVHTNINKTNQEKLELIVKKSSKSKIYFINVGNYFNFSFKNKFFSHGDCNAKFTIETIYRCLPVMIKEFDQYDRIIYSDADIVVVDDISDLYNIDLKNKYLAGVKTPAFLNYQISHLADRFKKHYFGGGLWVMNLKKMRKDKLHEKILDIINNPPTKLLWPDQDIMNIACDGQVTYLSYQYVSIPYWINKMKELDYKDEYYPNNELYRAMYSPKIIHYAALKPWNDENSFRADLWFYWLKKTPFYIKKKNNLIKDKIIKKIKLIYRTLLLFTALIPLINKKINYEDIIRKINKDLMIY